MTARWGDLFDRARDRDVTLEAVRAELDRVREPGGDGSAGGEPAEGESARVETADADSAASESAGGGSEGDEPAGGDDA